MKRCPECERTFTNSTLTDCLNDGAALVEGIPAPPPYFRAPVAGRLDYLAAGSARRAPRLPVPDVPEIWNTATYSEPAHTVVD